MKTTTLHAMINRSENCPEHVIPALLEQISGEEATEMFKFLIAQNLLRWCDTLNPPFYHEIVEIFLEKGRLSAEDLTRFDKNWERVRCSAVLHAAKHLTEHGVCPRNLSIYFWLVLDSINYHNFYNQNLTTKLSFSELSRMAIVWISQHRRMSNKIN